MGTIVLGILVLWEVIFAVFCIATKSYHRKEKNTAYIVSLGVFVLLSTAKIIQLSFRWYLLGGILVLFAIMGVIGILKTTKATTAFQKRKVIVGGIGKSALVVIAVFPALIFPQYTVQSPTGTYKVATSTYTFEDTSRKDPFLRDGSNRRVNVELWYPQNAKGKYPLVVFDHGAGGVKKSNQSVFLELASQGYIVCSIDHPGHSFYTKFEDGTSAKADKGYLQEVADLNTPGKYNNKQAFEIIQKWMKLRTEDIQFVMNTVLDKAEVQDASVPYSLIDKDKIGVLGHSMGAAVVEISRQRKDIDAVINIDGPYFGEIEYKPSTDTIEATKVPYTTPILNIYSDQVWSQLKDGNTTGVYAANKISSQICTQSFDLYLKGAKHLTLTDLAMISPTLANSIQGEKSAIDLKACRQRENTAIVQFFNCYLKEGTPYTQDKVSQ